MTELNGKTRAPCDQGLVFTDHDGKHVSGNHQFLICASSYFASSVCLRVDDGTLLTIILFSFVGPRFDLNGIVLDPG